MDAWNVAPTRFSLDGFPRLKSVADLVRTWLRVLSSPGESDRTVDHR
jgi:hypothetical protein